MKIIKEGKLPTYKGICKICGCEFEASYGEVSVEATSYECIEDTLKYSCKCPYCGTLMTVSKI